MYLSGPGLFPALSWLTACPSSNLESSSQGPHIQHSVMLGTYFRSTNKPGSSLVPQLSQVRSSRLRTLLSSPLKQLPVHLPELHWLAPAVPPQCLCVRACSVMPDSATPIDCSPPGSSVHGILQARILEWAAISFSRGSSPPRDQTRISYMSPALAGGFFITGTTWDPVSVPEGKSQEGTWSLESRYSSIHSSYILLCNHPQNFMT